MSGSIRAALHAIAGCAGAAATGGDCTSAAAGSAATVALNNLIGADTTKMTAEQKQAYSNLMGALVAGVTAGVGGDAAAAQLASKVEVENNFQVTDIKKAIDATLAAQAACKGNAYFNECVQSKQSQLLAAYLKEERKKHLASVAHVEFSTSIKQKNFDDTPPPSGYANANTAPTIQSNSNGCVTGDCVAGLPPSRDTSAEEVADRASTAGTWSGRVGATATAAASVPGVHQPVAAGVALGANVASVGLTAIEHIARPNGGKLATDVVGTSIGLATEHIPIAGPVLAPLTNEAIEAAKNTSTATDAQNSINDWWKGLTK